jgi:HPt (histidine-containing phosphotransfer) domain-containing protein
MTPPHSPDGNSEEKAHSPENTPAARTGESRPACPETARPLHELLAALWNRSQSLIAERLVVLREAQQQLTLNASDAAARSQGADAAHKLAGILGTFGLPEGTELARSAEMLLEQPEAIDPEKIAELGRWVDDLEAMIRGKSREAASVIK